MRHFQDGFSLFELIVVIALTSLIGVWSATAWVQHSEDEASEAMGRWMMTVKEAVDQMLVRQADYLTGLSIPTVGSEEYKDRWRPSLKELIRAGHLAAGFPERSPLGYDLTIRVLKPTGLCLTLGCKIEVLTIATPQPSQMTQAGNVTRLGKMLASFGGHGASVTHLSPQRVRGATIDLPNPPALDLSVLPVGSIVLHSFYDTSAQVTYLRQGERRDVQLRANLTLAGRMMAGGDISTGGAINASGSLVAGGPIRSGGSISAAGPIHSAGTMSASGAVTAGGGITSGAEIRASGAISSGGAISAAGSIASSGHLQLGAVATQGTPCDASGLLAQSSAGGLLICQSGVWRGTTKTGGGLFIDRVGFGCDVRDEVAIDRANPLTGECSCPPSFKPLLVSVWTFPPGSYNEFYTYICLN